VVAVEAVGTTFTVFKVVPFAVNVTVPVGPTPPFWVATVAVNVTLVVVVGVAVFAVTAVDVVAGVTVMEAVPYDPP